MAVVRPLKVNVACQRSGVWVVELPDRPEPIECQTLDDARQIAYKCAASLHPCELVVRDAYHRVLDRQFIEGPAAA